MFTKILSFVLILIALPVALIGQEIPPNIAKVNLRVKFRIQVYGVERLKQVDDFLKHLKMVGFIPSDENIFEKLQDEKITFIDGTIRGGNESKCINPRYVYSVTSWPIGTEDPNNFEMPLRIEVQFPQYMQPKKQLEFWQDLKGSLVKIGFADGFAYDSENFTRITGNLLGKSLSKIDSEIFPDALKTAGVSFAHFAFPRVIKIHSDWPLVKSRTASEQLEVPLRKMSPQARKKVVANDQKLEKWLVTLNHQPPRTDEINEIFSNLNDAVVEGINGALFEILASPASIKNLANLPSIMFVTNAETQIKTGYLIKQNNLANLFSNEGALQPARNLRGVGVPPSIAVVGAEFLGWENAFSEANLNAELVDLTRTRNYYLEQMPYFKNSDPVGFHTKRALEIAKLNPSSKIVLVRIDPSIPTMLDEVAGFANRDFKSSYALLNRYQETDFTKKVLQAENDFLQSERAYLIDEFGETPEIEKRRLIYGERKSKWDKDNREMHDKISQILKLREKLLDFKSHKLFVLLENISSQLPSYQNAALSLFSDDSKFNLPLGLCLNPFLKGFQLKVLF